VIYFKPVGCNFAIQVPVPDCSSLQPHMQGFHALVRHEVSDRCVNEAASLAGLDEPVHRLQSGFRQDDIDAFAHGAGADAVSTSYTHQVCTSRLGGRALI
jgi:hypothetical protein